MSVVLASLAALLSFVLGCRYGYRECLRMNCDFEERGRLMEKVRRQTEELAILKRRKRK